MTSPVFDPGAVHVGLRWQNGRAYDITVRVERPTAAALLRGRRADEAVRMLPLLYAICGVAQGAAAGLALAAARGESQEAAPDPGVLAEARREHLWRLLLDWPEMLGFERQETLFVAGRKKLPEAGFEHWAAEALTAHCVRITQALSAGTAAAEIGPMLPPLTAAQTISLWPRLDAAFAAAPEHKGVPATTGALARHPELAQIGGLAARVMARAADLTAPAGLGRTSAAQVSAGVGRAAVETARGLLLHEITLDGDVVADYTIVAPTEWNFHPSGALKFVLEGTAAPDAAAIDAFVRRAVLAFDPCVRAHIDVRGG
jgi:hypothetical protein